MGSEWQVLWEAISGAAPSIFVVQRFTLPALSLNPAFRLEIYFTPSPIDPATLRLRLGFDDKDSDASLHGVDFGPFTVPFTDYRTPAATLAAVPAVPDFHGVGYAIAPPRVSAILDVPGPVQIFSLRLSVSLFG